MDVGGLLGNEAIRARLDAAAAQDRFSHSYLICGPDGSGKHTLAKILAAAMQCTGAGRKPCGRCEGCRKVFAGYDQAREKVIHMVSSGMTVKNIMELYDLHSRKLMAV